MVRQTLTRLHRGVIAAGILSIAVVVGLVAPGNVFAATYLEATAESGNLNGFSTNAGASATNGAAKNGNYGYEINTSSAPGYVQWSQTAFDQGHAFAAGRFWFQLNSRGTGESVDIVSVKNAHASNVNHFDIFITGDTQKFKWDIYSGNHDESSFTVNYNQWYYIEWQNEFNGTNHTATVKIDGVDQGTITSPGMQDTTVKSVWVGTSNAKTNVKKYDDIAFQVGSSTVNWLSAPSVPPVAATQCALPTYNFRGTVNPNGISTNYWFEYGTSTSYGSTTTSTSAGSGVSTQNVSTPITTLPSDTVIHYRIVASSASGTVYGNDETLVTDCVSDY